MYHNDQNGGFRPEEQPGYGAAPTSDHSAPQAGEAPTPQQPLYHSGPVSSEGSYTFRMQPADASAAAHQQSAARSGASSGGSGKRGPTWGKIIALCLACTVIGGSVGGGIVASLSGNGKPQSTTPVTTAQTVIPTTSDGDTVSYKDLYDACNPACVAISVSGTETNIFGQVSRYASAGSGFIISQDGYIVTNHHVISGSDEIEILLSDGTTYDAKLIGSDEAADIALLKIEAEGLSYLAFGNSDEVFVGQNVVAIGNPLGELANTMTTGIISALDREINIDGTVMNVLQTNTAVSPGNSGCPLLDQSGHVVGVINSKSNATSAEGIGFAIPSNDVQKVIGDIMEYGYVRGRAALGVTVNARYNSTYARYYNLPEGAYIEEVSSGSCADKAGLKANDIITKLGDREISSYDDLKAALQKYSAGETATITISRSGETKELSVTFDERSSDSTASQQVPGGAGREERQPDDDGENEDDNPFQPQRDN